MNRKSLIVLTILIVSAAAFAMAAFARHEESDVEKNVAVIIGLAGEQYPIFGTGGIKVTGGHHGFFSSNMKSSQIQIDGSAIAAQMFAPSEQSGDFVPFANSANFVTATAVCTLPSAAQVAGLEIIVCNTSTSPGATIKYRTSNGEFLRSAPQSGEIVNSTPGKVDRFISDGRGWYQE